VEQQEADRDLRNDVAGRWPDLGFSAARRLCRDEGRESRPPDDDDRPLQEPGAPRYTGWSGLQANSFALVSDSTATVWSGPYRIAADYKSNAPDVFDVSLAGAPNGTIYATSGIWQHVNEWNEQSVVASQMRPGETAFTRSVKVRDLVPAPINLPGERWRTSMQASIGVDASGTVYHLTGD